MSAATLTYTTSKGEVLQVPPLIHEFLLGMAAEKGIFLTAVERNLVRNTELFCDLGETLLTWARQQLGEGWLHILVEGYAFFVMDVNRHQHQYEKEGHYPNRSYEEVFDHVYGSEDFMKYYHWGVYVTTFAWEHHLKIMQFFRQQFLPLLKDGDVKQVLEFGAGSGVWSLLLTQALKGSYVTGIDISPYSVQVANDFVATLGRGADVKYFENDAILYKADSAKQAGLCCFLVEHLENPGLLLTNLRENLTDGAYAFVTTALTAAESDHIYEFRYESEVLKMMEDNGFRVIASYSSAPPSHPKKFRFLPRSIALVLQKRHNDLW